MQNETEEFFDSARYWIQRYDSGGNSGSGSYGRLAEFKASVFNKLVKEYGIHSVVDLGCGDGNQIGMFDVEEYVGIDISPRVIKSNSKLYAQREKWTFAEYSDELIFNFSADMSISIDVIYHLTEKDVFDHHLRSLFHVASKYVLIYGIDSDKSPFESEYNHMIFRKFTPIVEANHSEWKLIEIINNPYPYQPNITDEKGTSSASFFLFKNGNS
tara:strand:+ start:175 stop:816 length:642 start_codon:yes stop_codon:yes gene_type:complete